MDLSLHLSRAPGLSAAGKKVGDQRRHVGLLAVAAQALTLYLDDLATGQIERASGHIDGTEGNELAQIGIALAGIMGRRHQRGIDRGPRRNQRLAPPPGMQRCQVAYPLGLLARGALANRFERETVFDQAE